MLMTIVLRSLMLQHFRGNQFDTRKQKHLFFAQCDKEKEANGKTINFCMEHNHLVNVDLKAQIEFLKSNPNRLSTLLFQINAIQNVSFSNKVSNSKSFALFLSASFMAMNSDIQLT